MPASRAATAICSAPFECPSRPGLATSSRGGPPGIARTLAATPASPDDPAATAETPVGARYSPKHFAHQRPPLAGGAAGAGEGDRGRHHVGGVAGGAAQLGEGGIDRALIA